ncbi:hypothetical protein SAMN05216352_106280 [Alteribacillus bidgolensis]|uniref:Rhamnogalacturonan I lyase beta-sheet domain-containing protein n=1 Tax=Alteribacillus bidgolensis TaxID=930129 RepID=A0A1G8JPE6_9BACI|nr:hypothetical protein SAMN05216352_106280 [Alteribacillus bidgolensis]
MYLKKSSLVKKVCMIALVVPLLMTGTFSTSASDWKKDEGTGNGAGVQLEYLDRGLVAASTSEGLFLSWRLLADEVTGSSGTGLTGSTFHVYRNGNKIATVEDSTNYLDKDGTDQSEYYVTAIRDGKEIDQSSSVSP